MVTKLEVNIRSLLSNCEELSKDETNFWRLKKYIKSLDTMIGELQETESNCTTKLISEYHNRLQDLKIITNYQEPIPQTNSILKSSKAKYKESGDDLLKELNQIQNSKNFANLRKELIDDTGVRKRTNTQNESMDQAMKYYTNAQEKITEDMLTMTRSLKEQTETANKIIKRDTDIASKSAQMSDNNIHSLSKESDTLQDHSRKACKCWMWLMIGLVMVMFISMVMFMKIMKKKS